MSILIYIYECMYLKSLFIQIIHIQPRTCSLFIIIRIKFRNPCSANYMRVFFSRKGERVDNALVSSSDIRTKLTSCGYRISSGSTNLTIPTRIHEKLELVKDLDRYVCIITKIHQEYLKRHSKIDAQEHCTCHRR